LKDLIILGVDGMTWKVADILLSKNKMPNLQVFLDGGVKAYLDACDPLLTPIIWTSISSGVKPPKHGVSSFFNVPNDIKVPRIWDILSNERDFTYGLFRWPITGSQINNNNEKFVIPPLGLGGPLVENHSINPESYKYVTNLFGSRFKKGKGIIWKLKKLENIIAESLNSFKLGLNFKTFLRYYRYLIFRSYYNSIDIHRNRYERNLLKMDIYQQVSLNLMDKFRSNFTGIYIEETDHFGHLFWKDMVDNGPYRSALFESYIKFDNYLGEVSKRAGPNTTILIISDHGMRAINEKDLRINSDLLFKRLNLSSSLNKWQQSPKLYLWPDKNDKNLNTSAKLIDLFTNVKLKSFSHEVFNIKENEAGGISLSFSKKVSEKLYDDEIIKEEIIFDSKSICYLKDIIEYPDIDKLSGTHDSKGIFAIKGPNVKKGIELLTGCTINAYDVFPTLAYNFGLPISEEIDGRVVKEIYIDDFLNKNSIEKIDSYDFKNNKKDKSDSEISDAMIKRLKELGYM